MGCSTTPKTKVEQGSAVEIAPLRHHHPPKGGVKWWSKAGASFEVANCSNPGGFITPLMPSAHMSNAGLRRPHLFSACGAKDSSLHSPQRRACPRNRTFSGSTGGKPALRKVKPRSLKPFVGQMARFRRPAEIPSGRRLNGSRLTNGINR